MQEERGQRATAAGLYPVQGEVGAVLHLGPCSGSTHSESGRETRCGPQSMQILQAEEGHNGDVGKGRDEKTIPACRRGG